MLARSASAPPRTLAAALKVTEAVGIAIVAPEELEAEQGEE